MEFQAKVGGKKRKGENEEWDGRLRDTKLVLRLISLPGARSEKDGGINY